MYIIELIGLFIPLLIILDIAQGYFDYSEIKFKNAILDLDTDKEYSLKKIKTIFSNIHKLTVDIDDLSEFNIKRIQKLVNHVQGNLSESDTKYFSYCFICGILTKLLNKQKNYKNDKDKLLHLLTGITNELEEEKKFFGLNKREKEIFLDLKKNKNLSESDLKSISELKDIILNRYQELITKDEKSERLSKRSIYLGYISLLITAVSVYYSFSDKDIVKTTNNHTDKQVTLKKKT
jgi:hypothetical protein